MLPENNHRALITSYYDRKVIGDQLKRLQSSAEIIDVNQGRNLTLDEMLQAIPGIHATIAADEPYTREVFERGSELLIVARDGAGFDKIDLQAATDHGVVVTRAPVVFDATANLVVGLMIAMVRKIPFADQAIRQNKWTDRFSFLCPDLTGMTLGIVGFGQVGQKVAVRARALGMKLLAYDIVDVREAAHPTGTQIVSLDELLAQSDVVSVHLRHTPETRNFFCADLFAKMKTGGYFVNTSRGRIVKEDDLTDALACGHLAGAALDVFEQEPVNVDNPLLAMPNVVLTPHVAGDTSTTMVTAIEMNVMQILDLLAGKKPSNMLNPEVWNRARIHQRLSGHTMKVKPEKE